MTTARTPVRQPRVAGHGGAFQHTAPYPYAIKSTLYRAFTLRLVPEGRERGSRHLAVSYSYCILILRALRSNQLV